MRYLIVVKQLFIHQAMNPIMKINLYDRLSHIFSTKEVAHGNLQSALTHFNAIKSSIPLEVDESKYRVDNDRGDINRPRRLIRVRSRFGSHRWGRTEKSHRAEEDA